MARHEAMTSLSGGPKEGTLDWWMALLQEGDLGAEPVRFEIEERIRLVLLVEKTWREARRPELAPEQGMPANIVCGYLVEAAAQLLSVPHRTALRRLDYWSDLEAVDVERIVTRYFREEWTR